MRTYNMHPLFSVGNTALNQSWNNQHQVLYVLAINAFRETTI